jgi:hypothetical protein
MNFSVSEIEKLSGPWNPEQILLYLQTLLPPIGAIMQILSELHLVQSLFLIIF